VGRRTPLLPRGILYLGGNKALPVSSGEGSSPEAGNVVGTDWLTPKFNMAAEESLNFNILLLKIRGNMTF
jgi:hypothetical protein